MTTEAMEGFAAMLALALVRYLPPVVLPSLTPLRWAPSLVRIVLALGLAWLTILAMPTASLRFVPGGVAEWLLAAGGEFAVGMVFGLVLAVPQAALHMMGWVADVQAGLSAATLFDPGGQSEPQSLLGTGLLMLATVLFFVLDLHLDLYRLLVASVHVLPVGQVRLQPDIGALLDLFGSSFLLAVLVIAPVILGLFAVDVGVSYATRSMPQANVYFLMLPLKVGAAMLLMAVTLPYVPAQLERLFRGAFERVPIMLGA